MLRGVVDKYATLVHHFFHMPQAQRIGQIPAHAHDHHLQPVMQALDDFARRRAAVMELWRKSSMGQIVD